MSLSRAHWSALLFYWQFFPIVSLLPLFSPPLPFPPLLTPCTLTATTKVPPPSPIPDRVLPDGQDERGVAVEPSRPAGVGGDGGARVRDAAVLDVHPARRGRPGGGGEEAAVAELGHGGVVCKFGFFGGGGF